jgi:hypothetical protein
MTINEAITRLDSLKPNGYTLSDKIGWLSIVDGMIKNNIIDTHEGADEEKAIEGYIKSKEEAYEKDVEKYAKRNGVSIEEARTKVEYTEITYKEAEEHIRATRTDIFFNGYNDDTPLDTELLVKAPYDELYISWLSSKVDYFNGEYVKYNNNIVRYNDTLSAYASHYNRTHMPKGKKIKFF